MSTELIARLVVSIIAAINAAAAAFGFNPLNVDQQTVYAGVSFIAALIAWIWGFWKNNNFTQAAIEGQKVTDAIKAGKDVEVSTSTSEEV